VIHEAVFVQARAAVVAESGFEMVFLAAASATVAELARRHCQEQAVVAFDQFHVPDNKGVIKGERAKRLEAASLAAAQIDANLRDLHDVSWSQKETGHVLCPALGLTEVVGYESNPDAGKPHLYIQHHDRMATPSQGRLGL